MGLNSIHSFDLLVPYSSHVSPNVIQTKKYDLVTTWQLEGVSSECKSMLSLDVINRQIHEFLKNFAGDNLTFYVHFVRQKMHDSFTGKSSNYFADRINHLYYDKLQQTPFRKNTIYLTAVYSPYTALTRVSTKSLTPAKKKAELVKQLKIFDEYSQNISIFLKRFGGMILTTYTNDKGITCSQQLEFYNFLISGVWQTFPVKTTPIFNSLGTSDVYLSNQSGQINALGKQKYFRLIEILEFPEESNSLSMESIITSNCDFVMTQSFSFAQRRTALSRINGIMKKLRATSDEAVSQQIDIADAKDELAGSEISFGYHHFGMVVYGESLDDVIEHTNKQMSILSDGGFIPKLAELSLVASFLAQLPGLFDLRSRVALMSSRNFVDFASFHNFESGKRDKNCWGEAMAILKTPNKQPYYLNLHDSKLNKDEFGEKNAASTAVIGETGAGKTMLLSFLLNMIQKYGMEESFDQNSRNKKLTTIFLDKDRGAELNIRALGGRYCKFEYGEPTGWNPFCLPATHQNIAFVQDLIKLLCTMNGSSLNTRQEYEIARSVKWVMQLTMQQRAYGISRLIEALNRSSEKTEAVDSLTLRLKKWSKAGEYGWIFDNENDNFSINECNNFGFDGTNFLDKKNICGPISFYILHRISEILDGRRVVIFIDEFWKWLSDDVFAKFAEDKLKTIRKLNGMLIYATQSPDEVLKSPIARTLVEQCSTQIFLANEKATQTDYTEGFKLTEEEYSVIKNLDKSSRCFLVKKSSLHGDNKKFSVVVKLDLSALGANAKILSSSADNLKIFEEIHNDNLTPEDWIDDFLKVAV